MILSAFHGFCMALADRKEFLTELIQAMEPELPAPKRRRKPDAFSL